jgi:EAL domain-containing protein (putative c-di-GMP-specific phosphodiesterase class I)
MRARPHRPPALKNRARAPKSEAMRRRPWSSSRLRLDLVELGLVLSATALYLVVIAAVSLTAAAKESRDVRGGEIDEAKAELAVLSAMALQPRAVGAPARRQELSEGARRELDAVMARLGAPANGHRVRFWRPDGTILYRSPGDREPAPPPPVRRARLGDAWSAERRGPRDGGGALVTYVPVVTGGRLDGVLEAAHPLERLRADEATERNGVLVFFGAVGAVVWLGLLPLGVRLARMVAAAWDPVGRRLLRRMRRAITDGELELHYQPKMDLSTGTLDGVEALVRWRRDGVLVPPGEFLGVIEQSPLIRRLTLFVLDAAVRQAREWEREGRPTRVAVNLAAVSLADAAIVGDVAAALRRHDVEPSRLTLEITETAVLGDEDTAGETLAQLAELGVCLSVDDFGTGHSSLARVTRYPFDELKIDRSFVTLLTREKRPIVATIIRLAKTLGLRVVAEGVEDEATLNALRALGCDVAQGYLLAPPAPAADLPDAVRALSAMTRRATGGARPARRSPRGAQSRRGVRRRVRGRPAGLSLDERRRRVLRDARGRQPAAVRELLRPRRRRRAAEHRRRRAGRREDARSCGHAPGRDRLVRRRPAPPARRDAVRHALRRGARPAGGPQRGAGRDARAFRPAHLPAARFRAPRCVGRLRDTRAPGWRRPVVA